MALTVGGTPVKSVYVGSTPVKAVYVGSQKVWPTIEVHEVSLTDVNGRKVIQPLLTVTVPAGETWTVRIQGRITKASSAPAHFPFFRIGTVDGAKRGVGAVDVSGTVTSTAPSIALVTPSSGSLVAVTFTGTVTIEK